MPLHTDSEPPRPDDSELPSADALAADLERLLGEIVAAGAGESVTAEAQRQLERLKQAMSEGQPSAPHEPDRPASDPEADAT